MGSLPITPTKKINIMTFKSIQKNEFIVDIETGEFERIKHLNQVRIDRGSWNSHSRAKGWNKSGKLGRMKKSQGLGCIRLIGKKYKGISRDFKLKD